LLPKKKTSSGFEFVSGLAAGASAMPAKWSRCVFSFRFYEGKISVPVTLTSCAFRKSYPDVMAPGSRHDDQVDSISQVLNHAKSSSLWVWRKFGALPLSTVDAHFRLHERVAAAYIAVSPSLVCLFNAMCAVASGARLGMS